MKSFYIILCVLVSLTSCISNKNAVNVSDDKKQSKESSTNPSRKEILKSVSQAIRKNNKRVGYMELQKFEDLYMSNDTWMMVPRLNPADFKSREEILQLADDAARKEEFLKSYILYRLLLPELR